MLLELMPNGEFLKTQIENFDAAYREFTEGMDEAIEKKDVKKVKKITHKFKTTCGVVGAEKLADLCQLLEEKKKFSAKISTLLKETQIESEKCRILLEQYLTDEMKGKAS